MRDRLRDAWVILGVTLLFVAVAELAATLYLEVSPNREAAMFLVDLYAVQGQYDRAVMAALAGVRPGICMIAEPTLIRVVVAASHDSTVMQSVPHASATQAESKPSRSASCAFAISSVGFVPGGA